jgi:hypothetical protein
LFRQETEALCGIKIDFGEGDALQKSLVAAAGQLKALGCSRILFTLGSRVRASCPSHSQMAFATASLLGPPNIAAALMLLLLLQGSCLVEYDQDPKSPEVTFKPAGSVTQVRAKIE